MAKIIEINEEDGGSLETRQQPPEFALFPKLPFEIRLKIWKMSKPLGRIVRIVNVSMLPPKVKGLSL
jgi:hypothetical protein